MTTLKIERKLAAINGDNHEDHPRKNQARNTNSLRIQEGYITHVSKEIEGRVIKKHSQEFTKTESCILNALSRLHEFLLSPQARVHSGPVPETSRKSSRGNQGTNEDHSQNDPHPEAGPSQESSPEEASDSLIFPPVNLRRQLFSGR